MLQLRKAKGWMKCHVYVSECNIGLLIRYLQRGPGGSEFGMPFMGYKATSRRLSSFYIGRYGLVGKTLGEERTINTLMRPFQVVTRKSSPVTFSSNVPGPTLPLET